MANGNRNQERRDWETENTIYKSDKGKIKEREECFVVIAEKK